MTLEKLISNFELLGDWEERYGYLIDLGKKLPGLPDAEKTEDNRVHGCQAMVWMIMEPDPERSGATIVGSIEPLSVISKGLDF
jgi:cysteine desulfuration protein SufE